MKLVLTLLLLLTLPVFAQQDKSMVWRPNKKGSFYFYFGWNRDAYTKSDINFHGTDYNFTLHHVIANDRQTMFRPNVYFNPATVSIPQYNMRFGYYISDKWEISLGVDHMKYVMKNYQNVQMDGYINNSGTQYDGTYNNKTQNLSEDFLKFEHTDGLNYLNAELRRSDLIYGNNWFTMSVNYGAGIGALMPRTNTTLLNNARYDEFHLAGFGLGAVGSVKFNFWKYFFLQAEAKYGFIDMPDIRTTMHTEDRAKQHFWFMQYNGLFGVQFQLSHPEKHMKPSETRSN